MLGHINMTGGLNYGPERLSEIYLLKCKTLKEMQQNVQKSSAGYFQVYFD